MRKEYDFTKGSRPNPYARRLASRGGGRTAAALLGRKQIRELERRIRDTEDRTRYLLATVVGPRFILYYNVSDDCYGMNNPDHATLFKRRQAALAIRSLLGGRMKVVRCRIDDRGTLVYGSLPSPFPKRRPRGKGPAKPTTRSGR